MMSDAPNAIEVSILIPTHNRCAVLLQTLESLNGVVVPPGVTVELIVVPNGCTDGTEAMLRDRLPLVRMPSRSIVQEEAGLSLARNRCVAEAKGEILAFLDDDVWIEPGWLEGLVETYRTQPADVVGGPVRPWWLAVERPDWWCARFDGMLSARDYGPAVREMHDPAALLGANFSFRRHVFDRVGSFRTDLGRKGAGLGAWEETEFLVRAKRDGFRIYYSPKAEIKHWVAPQRATATFMRNTAFGSAKSSIFAKAKFGPKAVLRSTVGYSYLLVYSGVLGAVGWVTRDRTRLASHQIFKGYGLGGLAGVWSRLRGHAS